jgi:hypothetical protein
LPCEFPPAIGGTVFVGGVDMFDVLGGKSLAAKIFGSPIYLTQNLVRPHVNRRRQANSGHLFVVDINSWVGLFAHLEWFLEVALHCEQNALTPCFMSTSRQYVSPAHGPDWFNYFFINRQLSAEDRERIDSGLVPICRMEGIRQLGLPRDYDSLLNLEVGAYLVRKYIGIKELMRQKVTNFFDTNLGGKCVLGIHYRGTDKGAEAPPIAYPQFREAISRFLEQNQEFNALFVSSDEQRFVQRLEADFSGSLPVVYHADQERSLGEVPVHRSKAGDGYRKAEEAIVNCLLLGQCDALLKNASYLSAWSKLFNPDLRVVFLNPPFADQLWFPERDLLDHCIT